MMTPLELGILLDVFCGTPIAYAMEESPQHEAVCRFLAEDLIVPVMDESTEPRRSVPGRFSLTDRGHCYVTAILSIPLPSMKWVMPPLQFR
jgi:hypothetical protein